MRSIWVWGLWMALASCSAGAQSEGIRMWMEVTPEGGDRYKVEVYIENTVPVGAFQVFIRFAPVDATIVEPYPERGPRAADLSLVKGNIPEPGKLIVLGLDLTLRTIEAGKGVLVFFYVQSTEPVSLQFEDKTAVFDPKGDLIWRFTEEPKIEPSENTWGKIKALFRF